MRLLLFFLVGFTRTSWAFFPPPDTLRPTSPDRLLAYTYANDFLFRTDYYFTQGMTLALVHPVLARSPVNYLLPKGPIGSSQHYGIRLRYDGFTPLRIQDDFIRIGDRPYASYIYASLYRVSTQPTRHQRLTTAVEIGFIGPAAGAKQFQTQIHELTNNPRPLGWDYQIGTAPVLGYRAGYEKQLLAAPGAAELLGTAEASLGTLYTYGSAGLRLRAGRFNPYFSNLGLAGPGSRTGLRRLQCYLQANAEVRAIGYDATMQGGLLGASSPYTLSAAEVRRAVLRSSVSLVLAYQGFSLTATDAQISPEFAGARWHRWAQLGLTAAF